MSIRRLARIDQSQSTGLQTTNWTTEATETYNSALPADSPSSWGTDPELANLDRDFDATGSTKTHLGLLATITSAPDLFWGAVVKLQVTYAPTDDPQLELWTHDTPNGWVRRRRVDVPALARTGDPTIFDLTLSSPLEGVDKVWITLVPTTTETNNWVSAHLYGDCNVPLPIPDCPQFSDPADCSLAPPGTFPGWEPDPVSLEPIPGVPVPTDFPLPPIIISIPMPPVGPGTVPRQYEHRSSGTPGWYIPCPGPTTIRMYFSIRAGSSVRVTVFDSPAVVFVEGTTQLISGSGVLNWTVLHGFTLSGSEASRGDKFLPPRQLVPDIKFEFTPAVNFSTLDFFDWESFLWTFGIFYTGEIC